MKSPTPRPRRRWPLVAAALAYAAWFVFLVVLAVLQKTGGEPGPDGAPPRRAPAEPGPAARPEGGGPET